ncbi:hypothetical protein HY732_02565 [Candidatus Uhrbacteria bacterium]|nr:hypothetical protein [Candidatus Uhrbacteria bacterium]
MIKLTIEEVENGYILSSRDSDGEEWKKLVLSDPSDDREGLKELLAEVANYFGERYDKFGSENLNITFDRKGHKA